MSDVSDMGIMEYFDQDYNPDTGKRLSRCQQPASAQSYRTDTMTTGRRLEKILQNVDYR
jgi:hypothetical protein